MQPSVEVVIYPHSKSSPTKVIMAGTTLLSLPQEIRDMIFSYLTQEVVVHWGYRISPFPLGGHEVARVRIAEAPLTNVLVSCAQIYHEYSQDRRFAEPTVTVELSHDTVCVMREEQPTNEARVKRIFKRARRLEFAVDGVLPRPDERQWLTELLCRPVGRLAPHLVDT
ncbi:hypothetical protein BDU57DRAFT_168040 [Ampelomyces quisqualis]|uniref:Uncharacterized protein n=1 Tax=Ampelomyces quisqualis TaxID=50730 RepID=A0A6A5QRQ7_AMPQU|nr:hypothetical protein BDU57DRAFT_168040 [Ampelomyces quisqualis]